MGKKMEKHQNRGVAKQVKGADKAAIAKVTGDGKPGAKRNVDKALGKGKGALGSNKDKLSNDFST